MSKYFEYQEEIKTKIDLNPVEWNFKNNGRYRSFRTC